MKLQERVLYNQIFITVDEDLITDKLEMKLIQLENKVDELNQPPLLTDLDSRDGEGLINIESRSIDVINRALSVIKTFLGINLVQSRSSEIAEGSYEDDFEVIVINNYLKQTNNN